MPTQSPGMCAILAFDLHHGGAGLGDNVMKRFHVKMTEHRGWYIDFEFEGTPTEDVLYVPS